MHRRSALAAAGGSLLAACARRPAARPAWDRSSVVILRAANYSLDLAAIIRRGLAESDIDVRGKRVLLKPNLVEFSRETVINTHPAFVAAVYEVIRSMGAAEVFIGEGPGHRRDTYAIAEEAGYYQAIPDFESRFLDLNAGDVAPIDNFGTLGRLWVPQAALAADLIISLPKMKTHHWAGATLSMKNYFGLVPGAVYGWPKNILHHHGIEESIVALARQFAPKSFAIVDGIQGMEGNGPIQGSPRNAGVIVMGKDLVAVDATCARIMGFNAGKLLFLQLAQALGWTDPAHIDQRGEPLESVRRPFNLMPMWRSFAA